MQSKDTKKNKKSTSESAGAGIRFGRIMQRIGNAIAKDLWIAILDIIAVNLSYFLALLIRFYVNNQFRPSVSYYLTDFAKFAPYYTVLCIIVFACFKLYNGMWRYAGINDMNRIICATGITCVIQIMGTVVFVRRMPITYYVIGTLLQFVFVSVIRFAYRFIIVEQKKVASRKIPSVNAVVIGVGEYGRNVLHRLEDLPGFRPIAVVDCQSRNEGQMMNGLPVVDFANIEDFIQQNHVKAVFVADAQMTRDQRDSVYTCCERRGVEFTDYTGYISNLGTSISLVNLLEFIEGPVTLSIGDQRTQYKSGRDAIYDISDSYTLSSIQSDESGLVISIKPNRQISFALSDDEQKAYVGYEAWGERHKQG